MNLLKIHIEISNFNFFLINKYMKIENIIKKRKEKLSVGAL